MPTLAPVKVKICGITQVDDMLSACEAGADAIGLVFYAPSKRAVTAEQAAQIVRSIPPFVLSVGLFVNESTQFVQSILDQVPLQLLQFHGDESPAYCESFNRPYIKAIAVKPDESEVELRAKMDSFTKASGFLLDTYKPGVPGGTGETFDWGLFPKYHKPMILAGGLNADNVQQAIQQVQPYAVDVSGGVELSAGKKSVPKLEAFIQQAKLR